jgi:hypothetical protein
MATRQPQILSVAVFLGFDDKAMAAASGHSIREGAAQDLLALNIST